VGLDPVAAGFRVGEGAPPRATAAYAVDQVPADHIVPADEAEVDRAAVMQPLHDVVNGVVDDLVFARVGEALDALEGQRIVADLLPAELEATPLLAAELSEVIDRAVREQDAAVGHVVDVFKGSDVLSAISPGDRAGMPVEDATVVDVIAGDDVAPVDVAGAGTITCEQHPPAAAAHEFVPRDAIAPCGVFQPQAVA